MSLSVEVNRSVENQAKPSSPWAKTAVPNVVCSLEDVMSEQLASELQKKETLSSSKKSDEELNEKILPEHLEGLDFESASALIEPNTCDNDYILAQLLQLEMDKEFDEALKRKESFKNKNSRVHPVIDRDEKELNNKNQEDLSSESESEDEFTKLTFKRGVRGKGENMISKHDILLTSRHNAAKLANFSPDFETGDSHGFDMRLSNKVFNCLKLYSMQGAKRTNRINDKQDKSTSVMSLDPKTRLILFKMVNADILDSIGGVISTGKEATILYAPGGKNEEVEVPKECVAKVFKTTLNEFKTREKYIGDDYRFKDRYKHLNPQKIVRLWAEKEMHNLMKMRKYDIPCPDVVVLKRHVLIMSFIGSENVAAPKLKDADLKGEELKKAYDQSIKLLKDLYNKCNLVHADFNQFNLLWHEGRLWVIDVSQSVEPIHPMGLEFLLRDCTNVNKFFTNRKLEGVMSGEEIFNEVTGMDFKGQGQVFLSQIHKYVKEKRMEMNAMENKESKNPYNFDYYFEMSLRKKNKTANKDIIYISGDDRDEDDDDEDSDGNN